MCGGDEIFNQQWIETNHQKLPLNNWKKFKFNLCLSMCVCVSQGKNNLDTYWTNHYESSTKQSKQKWCILNIQLNPSKINWDRERERWEMMYGWMEQENDNQAEISYLDIFLFMANEWMNFLLKFIIQTDERLDRSMSCVVYNIAINIKNTTSDRQWQT